MNLSGTNARPADEPKDTDTRPDGGDGKLTRAGQVHAKDATRPKTGSEEAVESGKVDELAQELARQRDERQARADAVAKLDLEAKLKREAAAAQREIEEQVRRQRALDEEQAQEERQHNLMAFDKLNKSRRAKGLGPVSWESFLGAQA